MLDLEHPDAKRRHRSCWVFNGTSPSTIRRYPAAARHSLLSPCRHGADEVKHAYHGGRAATRRLRGGGRSRISARTAAARTPRRWRLTTRRSSPTRWNASGPSSSTPPWPRASSLSRSLLPTCAVSTPRSGARPRTAATSAARSWEPPASLPRRSGQARLPPDRRAGGRRSYTGAATPSSCTRPCSVPRKKTTSDG
jgi:hypothetical protein